MVALSTRRLREVVRSRIEPGLLVPATRYCEALAMRAGIVEEFIATVFGDADIVHLPAISVPVPTIAETTEGDPAEIGKLLGALTHCTRGINYLGLPMASVPTVSRRTDCLVGSSYSVVRLQKALSRRRRTHINR
jgi:Asp-tRNA(Asn)/Glu-tRNA(Gln) amidotransferase A subunit family amidase